MKPVTLPAEPFPEMGCREVIEEVLQAAQVVLDTYEELGLRFCVTPPPIIRRLEKAVMRAKWGLLPSRN